LGHLRDSVQLSPADRGPSTVGWVVSEVRAARSADEERQRAAERNAKAAAERKARDAKEAADRARKPTLYRAGLKADAAIREAIQAHRIYHAYHWTPLSSLVSILRVGIRPRAFLDRHGIAYEQHGYGQSRKAFELRDFVAVSLYPQRGMANLALEPVVLALDPSVVAQEGAFYTSGNTAGAAYEFCLFSSWTTADDLHALYEGPDSSKLVNWQAEVWVPGGIDTEHIAGIIVRDQATAAKVAAVQQGLDRRPLDVEIVPDLNHTGWLGTSIDLGDDPFAGI